LIVGSDKVSPYSLSEAFNRIEAERAEKRKQQGHFGR